MINTRRIYTIATLNGFSHQDVKWYIAMEFGLSTTKDLNTEQYNQLIKYLDREVENGMAKTFLGGGKKRSDKWLSVTLKEEVLNLAHWQEYNGKKFIKLNINIEDAPDQYGKDVKITLDDWKPDGQRQEQQARAQQGDGDFPF